MGKLLSLGSSNTQAERTDLTLHNGKTLRVLIDYLSFTFTDEKASITKVLEFFEFLLGLDVSVWSSGRRNYEGYKDSFVFENINIYYNGAENQGIHVDITGQGCRFIELLFRKLGVQADSWYLFIQKLRVQDGVKFTRVDLACDDFRGYYNIHQIYDKLIKGHVKSKFKTWRPHMNYDFSGDIKGGMTLYFGSPQSRTQLTMYEKDKQLGVDYFWLRTELRFHKQMAEQIINAIVFQCDPHAKTSKDLGIIFAGVLKDKITFLEPSDTDSNKRRWKVSHFWSNFLAGVEPLKIAMELPDRDIQRIHGWIEKQVSKGLAMLRFAFHDNDEEWLEKLYKMGASKLKEQDIRIIQDYRRMIQYMNMKSNNQIENDIFTQKNESSCDEDSRD